MGDKVQVMHLLLTAMGLTVPSFSFCVFETRGSQSLVPSLRVSQLRAEVAGFIPL